MNASLDVQGIEAALREAWSARSSSKWTADAPAVGQCSPTAWVVQDRFGGAILKTPFQGAWHFYNRIGGQRFDFTAEQFSVAPAYEDHPATRDEALLDCTEEQHANLARRFLAAWAKPGRSPRP
jgi:hypothetical protein